MKIKKKKKKTVDPSARSDKLRNAGGLIGCRRFPGAYQDIGA